MYLNIYIYIKSAHTHVCNIVDAKIDAFRNETRARSTGGQECNAFPRTLQAEV